MNGVAEILVAISVLVWERVPVFLELAASFDWCMVIIARRLLHMLRNDTTTIAIERIGMVVGALKVRSVLPRLVHDGRGARLNPPV